MSTNIIATKSEDIALKALYDDYLEKYNKIEKDMDYEAIEAVMGKPGEVLQETAEFGGSLPVSTSDVPHPLNAYVWDASDEAGSSIHVSVLFSQDGASVLTKRFIGSASTLIPQSARTTKERFSGLSNGMTYDEAVAVLGTEGFMSQKAIMYFGKGKTFETYAWWQNDNASSMMTLWLQDGKTVMVDEAK
jgi:hypothetical protein